MTMSSLN